MVATWALIAGGIAIVLGLLIVRFVLKTAFTLAKIAIIIGIALAVWLGIEAVAGDLFS